MTTQVTGPPEVEIVEARAERLDDVGSLWRAMHEYHAEVAGEAREVAPFRRAEDSWQRRRGEFERWMRAGDAWLLIAERDGSPGRLRLLPDLRRRLELRDKRADG
ncbi:MAG TPA: hypothetical protein VFZ41_09225 [Solirubrobacterales bacterium]